jgi:hypothetical protein
MMMPMIAVAGCFVPESGGPDEVGARQLLSGLRRSAGGQSPAVPWSLIKSDLDIESGFLEYRILDEVDEDGDDCASDAATGQVTKRRADVESAAAGRAEGWNQALQDGSANSAANGTRDRFGEGAEINIFQNAANGIPANRSGHDLQDKVDNRC